VLHLVVSYGCFFCCGGVWISTPCWVGLFCVWTWAEQKNGHVRANGNSVIQLNVSIPGRESVQTGPPTLGLKDTDIIINTALLWNPQNPSYCLQKTASQHAHEGCCHIIWQYPGPHCLRHTMLYTLEGARLSFIQPGPLTMWLPCIQLSQNIHRFSIWIRWRCRGCGGTVVPLAAQGALCEWNMLAGAPIGCLLHHAWWLFLMASSPSPTTIPRHVSF
jgi:hypothetical protein